MEISEMPMQTLDQNVKKEIMQFFKEVYVEPLEKFGFELKACSSYGNQADFLDIGFHMIYMTLDEKTSPGEMPWDEIFEITDQNDDSQPHSTHRYYNGDLWIFIPFYA